MSKKSAPVPPYKELAEQDAASAQAANAQQTAANRPNQVGPYGSVGWEATKTIDPSTGKPVTSYKQTTKLDPRLQEALDAQIATEKGRSNIANSLMPQVQEAFKHGIDFGQFSPLAAGAKAQYTAAGQTPQATHTNAITNPYALGPRQQNINTTAQGTPTLNTHLGGNAGQGMAKNINYQDLANVDNADAQRQDAFNNLYSQATSRLDPQYQQRQTQLETQLANQGIVQGSDAYNNAMSQFGQTRTDAYNQALMSAQSGAGQQAQINYNMQMGLRQQQAQEAQNSATFQNAAQQQSYAQMLGAGEANNTALGQAFTFGNQSRAEQLAAQNAAFQQSLSGANFGLQQQNQAYEQNLGANAQNFTQGLQSGNQNFQQNLVANAQNFAQAGTVADYQNKLRQQQIAEAQQKQNWSLNSLNALLQGQQVQNPQFSQFISAQGGQGTDLSGAAQKSAAGQQANLDASNAAKQQLVGTMAAMAAAYASDRVVKTDIKRIGRHPRGFGIYRYRYIGERGTRVGVIAQDVRRYVPTAVIRNRAGWLMVKYSEIGVPYV